jgi:isoquinoline 1-oxidoreductase beta subunit
MEPRFVASGAKPGGTGELGPVPTHAAFANALVAAGGPRLRALPISRAGLRLA